MKKQYPDQSIKDQLGPSSDFCSATFQANNDAKTEEILNLPPNTEISQGDNFWDKHVALGYYVSSDLARSAGIANKLLQKHLDLNGLKTTYITFPLRSFVAHFSPEGTCLYKVVTK